MSIVLRTLDLRIPGRLNGITAEFQSGRVYGLLGPNGSGKTTYLQTVSGLLGNVYSGKVDCLGADLREASRLDWARRMAYVPADLVCEFPLTVREYIGLGGFRFSDSEKATRVNAVLGRCELLEFADRNTRKLSDGERQKVQIARTLVQDPKVFVLDEALSRLDLDQRPKFGQLLRDLAADSRIVLWVSHDLEFLRAWSDEVLLFRGGELVGSVAATDVLKTENLQKAYPGFGQKA